jgi:glycosyltransferase involved in cell wall biosynthesis
MIRNVMTARAAVIIPVYNAVRYLELVLTGYLRQNTRDFELIVADDGSGPEVRALVEKYSRETPFSVRYVHQPDEGFRRSSIFNCAVKAASAPHLIFADADCIPHRNFVAAHCDRSGARRVLCGRRVHLRERMSHILTPQDVLAGKLERLTPSRIFNALLCRDGHWDEGLILKNRTVHRWVNHKEPTLLGSNFSMEKALLEEINGFNEDFVGYGGEDTELEFRLRLAGARFVWVRHLAVQYHLFHPVRSGNRGNIAVLEQTRTTGKAVCTNGLSRLKDPL